MLEIKAKIQEYIKTALRERTDRYERMVDDIKESLNNETKSSAGDKFETGRAMMSAELDKVQAQLAQVNHEMSVIESLTLASIDKVELGAYFSSGSASYYLSTSFGKVKLDRKTIYAISPNSPIGQAALSKTVGDSFTFNGRIFIIDQIC